jgi:hypothetical protein
LFSLEDESVAELKETKEWRNGMRRNKVEVGGG